MILPILFLLLSSSPDSLSAKVVTSVQLKWTASTSPGVTNYTILRSTVSGQKYVAQANVNGVSYTDTGVKKGKTYYYVVQAFCKKCSPQYSSYSNQAAVTVK